MAGKEPEPQGYLDFWGNTPMDPTTAQGKTFAPVSSGNSIANPLPPQLKGGPDRVINQIEQAADYYGPMFYQLLGYHSSLELNDDLNGDFIPVSQTKSNPKLFVVGLIPPSANITGRVLDRSASIGATEGYPDQVLDFSGPASEASGGTLSTTGSVPGPIITASGYKIGQGSGTASNLPNPPQNPPVTANGEGAHYEKYTIPQLWNLMGAAYADQYQRQPTPTELQLYVAQALNETGSMNTSSVPNNNFGGIGSTNIEPTKGRYFKAPTKTEGYMYFTTYPDPQSGAKAFIVNVTGKNPNVMQAARDGDVLGYSTSLAQSSYYMTSADDYYHGVRARASQVSKAMAKYGVQLDDCSDIPVRSPGGCAFKETGPAYRSRVGNVKGRVGRFLPGSPYNSSCPLLNAGPQTQDGSNSDWKGQGSANASASRKEEAATTNRDLNKSDLGAKYQSAQRAEAAMTARALDRIRSTPPLRLLVNPTSFKISSEKVVSDGNFTREGHIIEHWGEQQDKMSLSGKVAAFFAIDTMPSPNQENLGGGPGLTRVARQYSASYQNFLSLYLLYRNNGGLYVNSLGDTLKTNLLARLSLVGSIYIYYDNTLYIGSFDTFDVTENDSAPYSLEYNIEFTVRATFTLDEPTEYDYNVAKTPQSALPTTSDPKSVEETGGGPVALPPGLTPEQAREQSRQEAHFKALAKQNNTTGENLSILKPSAGASQNEIDTFYYSQTRGSSS